MKRKLIALLAVAMLIFTASLLAHDKYRIIGTLTKVDKSQVQVKAAKDSKIYRIMVDAMTIVSRDKDKVPFTELKVGRSVVVNAIGDSLDDLVAVEIYLVPPITKPPSKK